MKTYDKRACKLAVKRNLNRLDENDMHWYECHIKKKVALMRNEWKNIKPPLKQTAFNSYKALDQNNEREVEKRTRKKDWIVIKCISVFLFPFF